MIDLNNAGVAQFLYATVNFAVSEHQNRSRCLYFLNHDFFRALKRALYKRKEGPVIALKR